MDRHMGLSVFYLFSLLSDLLYQGFYANNSSRTFNSTVAAGQSVRVCSGRTDQEAIMGNYLAKILAFDGCNDFSNRSPLGRNERITDPLVEESVGEIICHANDRMRNGIPK